MSRYLKGLVWVTIDIMSRLNVVGCRQRRPFAPSETGAKRGRISTFAERQRQSARSLIGAATISADLPLAFGIRIGLRDDLVDHPFAGDGAVGSEFGTAIGGGVASASQPGAKFGWELERRRNGKQFVESFGMFFGVEKCGKKRLENGSKNAPREVPFGRRQPTGWAAADGVVASSAAFEGFGRLFGQFQQSSAAEFASKSGL